MRNKPKAPVSPAGDKCRSALNVSSLYAMLNTLQLAAFAAEANRVLQEIHDAAEVMPELGVTLSAVVNERGQWLEHPLPLSSVLAHLAGQVEAMIEQSGD